MNCIASDPHTLTDMIGCDPSSFIVFLLATAAVILAVLAVAGATWVWNEYGY